MTALIAATIGTAQNDIKKVLAYSTVSQLGYMFAAVGVGAYSAGVFHLMTHAFFKACLFLGSGSVIHAMGGEQDMTKMGGLRHKMPITFITFVAATLALAGVPPFAGFMSKDEIIWQAFAHGHGLGQVGRPSDAGSSGHEPEKGRDPRAMAELTNAIQLSLEMRCGLDMNRHAVRTSVGERFEITLRLLDHHVNVERKCRELAHSIDHLYAKGDVGDKVSIHHIEVNHVRAARDERLDRV